MRLAFETIFAGRVLDHMLSSVLVNIAISSRHRTVWQSFLFSETVVVLAFSGVISELDEEEKRISESIIDN